MGIQKITPMQANEDLIRRQINDLETIIELLKKAPESFDEIMRALQASLVPMYPRVSKVYNVTTAPTFLLKNDNVSLMGIRIRNEDVAVFVYVGGSDIIIPAGERIDPAQTVFFNLRRGQEVWGVSAMGTVQVIISLLDSAYSSTVKDGPIYM